MQFCVKIIIIEGWVDNIDFSILSNAFFDEALFLKSLTFYKISLNLIIALLNHHKLCISYVLHESLSFQVLLFYCLITNQTINTFNVVTSL